MTTFKDVVHELMAERGVKTVAELHRRIVADGGAGRVSYGRVRRWAHGDLTLGRDRTLSRSAARALGLDADERERLALASLGL